MSAAYAGHSPFLVLGWPVVWPDTLSVKPIAAAASASAVNIERFMVRNIIGHSLPNTGPEYTPPPLPTDRSFCDKLSRLRHEPDAKGHFSRASLRARPAARDPHRHGVCCRTGGPTGAPVGDADLAVLQHLARRRAELR